MFQSISEKGLLPYIAVLAAGLLLVTIYIVKKDSNDYAVASAHPLATEAGMKILEQGGNAFDAAVAITSTLAVVEPAGSGLGGGGFWLLYDAEKKQSVMLDGREVAPLGATRDMYLDADGKVIDGLSINGPLAAGIPGEPAALVWLAEHYGTLELDETLSSAIQHAENGFPVTAHLLRSIGYRHDTLKQFKESSDIFLRNGDLPPLGELIIQPNLANTLRSIAEHGHEGFYNGEVAERLVDGVQKAGGIWTLEDLQSYEVKVREPVTTNLGEMTVTAASLPSSGGLVMTEIFNILSEYDLEQLDENQTVHLLVESMRRAYRDRAQYMGDSDFYDVPISMLTSRAYAQGLNQSIRLDKATASTALAPTYYADPDGVDTTHFSVLDGDGNRVSATLSINYSLGSGFIPEGTGVLLNDEMDDFSSKPGEPNAYGLVGAEANEIVPGKRMLSSMTPAFLETTDRIAVIGTPGGSRIITMVLLGALEFYHSATADEIVSKPRFHHQYLPDAIQYEPNALSDELIQSLKDKGHDLSPRESTWGNMHVVMIDKVSGVVTAASDPRGEGKAMVSD